MASELTVEQWKAILLNDEITNELDISIFQALYSFEDFCAPASEIGRLLGYKGKNTSAPLNSEIGRYAKRIAKVININFSKRSEHKYKFWDLFFNGWSQEKLFIWQLKDELIDALEELSLVNENKYKFAEELPHSGLLSEGLKKTITVNTYERNPKARQICIEHWGATCQVCNFDFSKVYGEIGKGFIHVHHLIPISEIAETYQINPIEDLRPVCPNCHAMLHTQNPPLTIQELKEMIFT